MTHQQVRKIYQLFDEADQAWRDIYEAPGIEHKPVQTEVPREDQEPNAVRRRLLNKGAALPSALEHRQSLLAAISADAPVVHRAARTGWREGDVFVSHRHVAQPRHAEGTIIPPVISSVGTSGQLDFAGDLEGWREIVEVAKHSTAMTVAICATFAAPLLQLVNRPNFALALHGPSRSGKSSAQLAAASALGFGREEDLPSLNATPAGLLAAALAFNDHMLPINEIGTARGPKREIYTALLEATYALTSGQDVLRHPRWTGVANDAASSSFQTICILSSEISPDAWAARNGQTRDDGEMARLIGVPVLFPQRRTIFDRPPSRLAGDAVAQWEREQFHRLRQELPHQRGVAFREYINALVKDREGYAADARELVARFERKMITPNLSPVARDIVAKFGVLFAGGVIAADVGVLPLLGKWVGSAMMRACRAALAELPDRQAELRADLRRLAVHLSSGSMLDLDNCTGKQRRMMRNADGYHEPHKDGRRFVVRAQVFSSMFRTPLNTRKMLEWLDDEGFLEHSRNRTQRSSNEWAQKQVSWPDGTRQRSISLYLPGGLSDLDNP